MSTASTPLPHPDADAGPALRRLSPLVLLAMYLIVPAVLLFVLLDTVATDLEFSRRISFDTHLFLVFSVLLQMPHATASLFTFADRDYLVNYKSRLAGCVVVALGTLALLQVAGPVLFMLCLMAYNFYHQNSQQAGIAAMVARNKSRLHELWRWLAIVIEMAGFLVVIVRNLPDVHVAPTVRLALALGAVLLMAAFGLVSVLVARQSKTAMGRLLIGAHTAMLFGYALLCVLNLPLLMMLAPVVVHDFTAFAFYINHNGNRNRDTKHNFFSRLRNVIPMPEYLLTPLMALLLGSLLFLDTSGTTTLLATGAILVNVLHFYLEGAIWKAGSLHRRHTLV